MRPIYIPQKSYKVLVRCMTFNQSKYIEDALNGFVMQQTGFPFICLIMDDCSTDGEQEVIKAWMELECEMGKAEHIEIEKSLITLVPHKSNANCHFAFYFLKQNLYKTGGKAPLISPWRERCEYEALCEGDDYWTDPNKLQKQVDFLDSNPEYSMCFHDAIEHWEDGQTTDKLFSNVEDREYSGSEIYGNWVIPTASTLIRKNVFYCQYYRKLISNKNFCFGDILLFVSCSHEGKIRGFSNVWGVYRRHHSGALANLNSKIYIRHNLEAYKSFGKDFKETARLVLFRNAKREYDNTKKLYYFFICCRANPIKAIYRFFFSEHI